MSRDYSGQQTDRRQANAPVTSAPGKRDNRGRKPLSSEQIRQREKIIISTYNRGYSLKTTACKAAAYLSLSEKTIRHILRKLLKQSRIKVRRSRVFASQQMDIKRRRAIIRMIRDRATMQEIADHFQVSRQRALELFRKVIHQEGPIQRRYLTTKEVSHQLGISTGVINDLCSAGAIKARRRAGNKQGTYLIAPSELNAIQRHPNVTKQRVCAVCGQEFIRPDRQKGQSITCSPSCRKIRHRQSIQKTIQEPPTAENLIGWHLELWERLKQHRLPQQEEWLTLSQATRVSGINELRLVWLRLRRLVTLRPHPEKKWRGKPVNLYARSEMLLAKSIYWKYH